MRFEYYPDTDSLYIALSEREAVESNEVAPNVVLDTDAEGNLVGIDIYQDASKLVDFAKLEFSTPFAKAA